LRDPFQVLCLDAAFGVEIFFDGAAEILALGVARGLVDRIEHGDAADFFDPFTGEGIYSALRGAELLAPLAGSACEAGSAGVELEALGAYEQARRDTFGGKWMVERIIGAAVACPAILNRAARGLALRKDLADTIVGVTGDVVPASAVLHPRYALTLAMAAFS